MELWLIFVFLKIVQMYNVKTSRLLFLKRNRMLIKVPPGFLKSWRDIFNYSPMDLIYW